MANQSIQTNLLTPGGLSRQKSIMPFIPFSSATLWRKIKAGQFPAPFKLSDNITVFRNDEINIWFAQAQAGGVQ